MSLLMQALQKAAKNRETNREHTREIDDTNLSLQPIEAAASDRPPSARPEQAAAIVSANQVETGIVDFFEVYRRGLLWGALALVILGMGGYFGLQLFAPSLFIKRAPITTAPIPVSATTQETVRPEISENQPLQTVAISDDATAEEKLVPAFEESRSTPVVPRAEPAKSSQNKRAIEPQPATRQAGISVKSVASSATVNPTLAQAYEALQAGQYETADKLYRGLMQTDPNSIDVLLGAAATSQQRGETEQASRYYLKILELEPKNGVAQAGLIGIFGGIDPLSSETRLKQLISREPSAYLYYTLGNLYADQSKWAAAQEAYFQAVHLQPDNADYAFNLAVGLEHISQPKVALHYYRLALQLAQERGRPGFQLETLQKKVELLTSALE